MPQNGTRTISISYGAGVISSTATNCIIIGTNSNCSSGTSNTILLGTSTSINVSNEFNLPQIDHFNIPKLTTLANGTGTLVQYGGANAGWVQASGGTYNSVEKIDTIISSPVASSSPPPQLTRPMLVGQFQLVSIVSPLGPVVQVSQVVLQLLPAHLVSTKAEAEAEVGR